MTDKQVYAKFYDPLTERWFTMATPPIVERSKPPTMLEEQTAKLASNLRIAKPAHVWQAIEATATATQVADTVTNGES